MGVFLLTILCVHFYILKYLSCNFKGNLSDRSVNVSFILLIADKKWHMVEGYSRNNILLFFPGF